MYAKILAGKYFNLSSFNQSYKPAIEEVEQDKADVILTFPPNFEMDLLRENEAAVFIAVNGINGVKASLGAAYLQLILQEFNQDIRSRLIQLPRFSPEPLINVSYRFCIISIYCIRFYGSWHTHSASYHDRYVSCIP